MQKKRFTNIRTILGIYVTKLESLVSLDLRKEKVWCTPSIQNPKRTKSKVKEKVSRTKTGKEVIQYSNQVTKRKISIAYQA